MNSSTYQSNFLITLMLMISFGLVSCEMTGMEEPVLSGELNQAGEAPTLQNAHLRTAANLISEETFEGGEPFTGQYLQIGAPHSFKVVSDPFSGSNTVGRFELRDSDPLVKGSKRVEVSFSGTRREKWYAYSVFFPTSGYKIDNVQEIITQWHQPAGGSPPNSVQIKDDKIYLRSINRSDTQDNSNKVYTNYPLGDVERGKWNEYVFHFIHSPNSDGLIEIWHNSKKIHTIKGPNMRREFDLPNFKFGIYKWVWANRTTEANERVLYFDNIRTAHEGASFMDMTSQVLKATVPIEVTESTFSQELTGFNLIQANTDQDLGPISNGAVITSPTHKLNIRTNVSSSFNGKVSMKLTGPNSHMATDDTAPYSLFGDDGNGNYYFGSGLPAGTYTLEATPYSNGAAGSTRTIKFTIKTGDLQIAASPVKSFSLIQANIDKDLGQIANGSVISAPTHKLNIRANTDASFNGEIRFTLSGAKSHDSTEDSAPFSLFGDDGGNNYYFGSGLYAGTYTLKATPYVNGVAGLSETIKFTVNL